MCTTEGNTETIAATGHSSAYCHTTGCFHLGAKRFHRHYSGQPAPVNFSTGTIEGPPYKSQHCVHNTSAGTSLRETAVDWPRTPSTVVQQASSRHPAGTRPTVNRLGYFDIWYWMFGFLTSSVFSPWAGATLFNSLAAIATGLWVAVTVPGEGGGLSTVAPGV